MKSLFLEEARTAPASVAAQLSANEDLYCSVVHALRSRASHQVVTLARGSSNHAAHYMAHLLMARYGRLVTSLPRSLDTPQRAPLRVPHTLAMVVSPSGRNPDLIDAMQALRDGGGTTVALINDETSPLARVVQFALPIHAGNEGGAATPKGFLCSLTAGARLAAAWYDDADMVAAVCALPVTLSIAAQADWSEAVECLSQAHQLMVIGRGTGLAIAHETAMRMNEMCGFPAEAFSGAEVLHRPIAGIATGCVVLVLAPRGPAQQGLVALAQVLRERGAQVVLAASPDVPSRTITLVSSRFADLDPIAAMQSFYILVEGVARARGYHPDHAVPRCAATPAH